MTTRALYKVVDTAFQVYADRLLNKIETFAMEKVIERNPYLLRVGNPNMAPADVIYTVLRDSVQPSREVMFSTVFPAAVLHTMQRRYGTDNLVQLDSGIIQVFKPAMFVALKSGMKWSNTKSAHRQRQILFDLAETAPADVTLLEAVVCGNCQQRCPRSNGKHQIVRLCGADMFEKLTGDRTFGYGIMIMLAEAAQAYANQMEFASFDDMIEQNLRLVLQRLMDTHRNGFRGVPLWINNVWDWDNHLRLNSGDYPLDTDIYPMAA